MKWMIDALRSIGADMSAFTSQDKECRHYKYYVRFCEEIDRGDWKPEIEDFSSYGIDGEGHSYTIVNHVTGQRLWVASSLSSFKDYSYHRDCDLSLLDVFDKYKSKAWIKAKMVRDEVAKHNKKIKKLEIEIKKNKKQEAINKIIG